MDTSHPDALDSNLGLAPSFLKAQSVASIGVQVLSLLVSCPEQEKTFSE